MIPTLHQNIVLNQEYNELQRSIFEIYVFFYLNNIPERKTNFSEEILATYHNGNNFVFGLIILKNTSSWISFYVELCVDIIVLLLL